MSRVPSSAGGRTDPSVRRVVLALHSVAAGGMETYAIDVAREFVERGITVTAIVPGAADLDIVEQRFRHAGVADVLRIDTTGEGGRVARLRRLMPIARTLRSLRPDVVHIHAPGGNGGLVLAVASRLATNATVVVTEHDVPSERRGVRRALTQFVTDRLVHATLAVSRRNASLRAARSHPRVRTFASILNGVPVAPVTSEERQEHRSGVRQALNIANDAVVAGSVVRLAPGKGLPDLLRAFALVHADGPYVLVIVGGGPMRSELEALAGSLRIAEQVRFAGEQDDPAPYIDAMDLFVLAVPEGSMSIALLEAMARGVPPVITFGGREVAVIDGETGLTAPPNNPSGLATVLARLLADGAMRERLGDAAAAHVRRHFSISRVADDLLSVYAAAKQGYVPAHLRADAPPNPRPGDRPGPRMPVEDPATPAPTSV
jgi:glycosyltransferase involved in cell wall biosynthesis